MSQRPSSNPDHEATSPNSTDHDVAVIDTDQTRRHFLTAATAAVGVVGVGFAATPFLLSLRPSAKAQAVGAPVTVSVGSLDPGEQITVMWRGRPVWVLRRTPDMLERLTHEHWLAQLRDPDSLEESQQPAYARNATRSIRPEYLVVVALCTHLGCVPLFEPEVASAEMGEDWMGGYFCPCHGSRFDLAGRVTKNVPAPLNLKIPPYRFLRSDRIEIGVDSA